MTISQQPASGIIPSFQTFTSGIRRHTKEAVGVVGCAFLLLLSRKMLPPDGLFLSTFGWLPEKTLVGGRYTSVAVGAGIVLTVYIAARMLRREPTIETPEPTIETMGNRDYFFIPPEDSLSKALDDSFNSAVSLSDDLKNFLLSSTPKKLENINESQKIKAYFETVFLYNPDQTFIEVYLKLVFLQENKSAVLKALFLNTPPIQAPENTLENISRENIAHFDAWLLYFYKCRLENLGFTQIPISETHLLIQKISLISDSLQKHYSINPTQQIGKQLGYLTQATKTVIQQLRDRQIEWIKKYTISLFDWVSLCESISHDPQGSDETKIELLTNCIYNLDRNMLLLPETIYQFAFYLHLKDIPPETIKEVFNHIILIYITQNELNFQGLVDFLKPFKSHPGCIDCADAIIDLIFANEQTDLNRFKNVLEISTLFPHLADTLTDLAVKKFLTEEKETKQILELGSNFPQSKQKLISGAIRLRLGKFLGEVTIDCAEFDHSLTEIDNLLNSLGRGNELIIDEAFSKEIDDVFSKNTKTITVNLQRDPGFDDNRKNVLFEKFQKVGEKLQANKIRLPELNVLGTPDIETNLLTAYKYAQELSDEEKQLEGDRKFAEQVASDYN